MIADRLTAAWVYGVRADPPAALHVCVDRARRGTASVPPGFDLRQCALDRNDVVRIGGTRVTSPLRTVVDLLRTEQRFTAGLALQLQALLDLAGATSGDCRMHIRRRAQSPGTRRALVRLAAVPRLARPAAIDSAARAAPNASARAHPIDVVDGVDPAHGIQHAIEVGRVAHLEHEPAESQAIA